MFATLKRLAFTVMLLSGIASIFVTLGTLNNRLPGGLTLQNTPWVVAVSVFAGSALLSLILKLIGPMVEDTTALN